MLKPASPSKLRGAPDGLTANASNWRLEAKKFPNPDTALETLTLRHGWFYHTSPMTV
jgi:hypothetical protein